MDKVQRAVDDIRRKWVPDGRLGVFDVMLLPQMIDATTTSRDARDALRRLAGESGMLEKVVLLPNDVPAPAAIVSAALAPLLGEPRISAPRVSDALHGEPLDVLEQREGGAWLRVRASDGYIAWINPGYLATGPTDWSADWQERATARSLSADIVTADGRRRLPTGARVALRRGVVELADGQRGAVAAGSVRREQELRVEARHLALPELAQKWYAGAPYLWGGRTEWGIDCSGLVQAVYGARGVALPRDSDQQFGHGREIPTSPDGKGYEAGDLLFFAERGRVSHVALWSGAGRIVHSALSRGGVGSDHLFGDEPRMVRMRESLVGVRRVDGLRGTR
ncbi:MAG TPA: C40 family peptidase [Gemmatimonadales bacterium]|nr:C40 family peptidase [Gemmatimonadales bacterium]